MAMNLNELEARALELIKAADFGDESIRVNEAIVALAPTNDRAWTRLGRCHLEQRRFDEAIEALRTALALNRTSTIATNLLNEVRKRRALTPTAAERTLTGFTAREFALLETLGPADACDALRSRIELLFDAVNASPVAARIVDARQRAGASGSKLFHANSCRAASRGHIEAFHHGGRWEPQFNLGWLAQPGTPGCMRIGIGFNTSAAGLNPDREPGPEQLLRYFEGFQRTIAKSWKRELARWMEGNGGFIQRGAHAPELSTQPADAVDWLLACGNAAAIEWIFVGRWLLLDRVDDAAVLRDRAKLARTVDDTFRALLPLWLTTYTGAA
jgi:hypothetical protein